MRSRFLLFLVVVAFWPSVSTVNAWQPPALPPASVVVAPVIQREVSAGQTFVGAAMPSRKSIVGSAVEGRVEKLFVNDGEPVSLGEQDESGLQRGEPVAQLLTDTISLEVGVAAAEKLLREQELAELEAGSRAEEIAQAKAKLGSAEALKEFAQSRYSRVKALFEQGKTTSREEFEESLSVFLAADQNQIAAQAAHQMAVAGPRPEQIAQARARLQMATEQWKKLESQKAKYTIRAPFDGFVVAKRTEVGEWVKPGDPVVEVVALDPIEIEVTVPEVYIRHVNLGGQVSVRFDALSDQTFTGEVARVIPNADLRSRTFPVKVQLANPKGADGHLIKAGMVARVTLAVGPKVQATLVPKDALVLGGPQPIVMLVVDDPQAKVKTVRPVPVQLGIAEAAFIQVTGDLRAGQEVVVVGNERVRPGQPIQTAPSDAAAARPAAGE
jgi:RND family efflux transporter MFP subunit